MTGSRVAPDAPFDLSAELGFLLQPLAQYCQLGQSSRGSAPRARRSIDTSSRISHDSFPLEPARLLHRQGWYSESSRRRRDTEKAQYKQEAFHRPQMSSAILIPTMTRQHAIMYPIINVLTRTSARPNGFKKTKESVSSQTYKYINHIICTDDKKSIYYIENHGIHDYIFVDRQKIIEFDTSPNPNTGIYFPQNLYFNDMMELIESGWIIYLDDDDVFSDNKTIQSIVNIINNNDEDTIIYWRMEYADGRVLPLDISEINPPQICHIGGSCFTFNYKYRDYAVWDGWKCSDFRVVDKLHSIIPKKIWIPRSYIFVPKPGYGKRNDS